MGHYIIGYYNEREYRVEVDKEKIYQAGNSPFDSQVYVSAEDGVGLDAMRRYCEKTSRDMAEEEGAEYLGVEYLEDE